MDGRLVQLLEKALTSREIGSLFIGQGRKMRQLFLAGNEVYLVGAGRELRFCPLPFVLDGTVVPSSELDIVLGRFGSAPRSLAEVLSEDYPVSDEQAKQLRRHETIEEALTVLEAGRDRFVFEPGTVPEEVLLPDDHSLTAIPNSLFHKALRKRVRERGKIEDVFPHPEELPVLTGEGSAQRTNGRQWLFNRVADLVDGFRDLNRIRKDSLFTPHLTDKLLAAAASRGWIRKKRFPEFQNLQLAKMNESDLADLARRIEAAIPHAVDEVPLRRTLAEVLERHGDRSQLLAHRIAIGDQLFGRKEYENALAAYREAVELAPRSPDACQRLTRVLEHFADEALARNDAEAARRFLEEALPLRPQDESIQLRIVQSHGQDEGAAARSATRLAGMLHQNGQGERALRFLHLALQSYPGSDVLRRTYINFLLDHGLSEHALRELEVLAGELQRRGHDEEARQIFEKIVRLDPDRVPKEQRAKLGKARPNKPDPRRVARRRKVARRRRVVASCVLAIAMVVGYEAWLWQCAGEIEQRAEALMQETVPPVGTSEHDALREEWRELLDEAESLSESYPLPLGTMRIAGATEEWTTLLTDLEGDAEAHLEGLLKKARLAEIRGSIAEAREIYRTIQQCATSLRWHDLAQEKLGNLENAHTAASELRARGDAALTRGNRVEAFRLLRELVDRYPSGEATAGVLLPVRIVSEPSGATILIDGQERGTSPIDVELVPFTPVEIIARTTAADGTVIEGVVQLEDPKEPVVTVRPSGE